MDYLKEILNHCEISPNKNHDYLLRLEEYTGFNIFLNTFGNSIKYRIVYPAGFTLTDMSNIDSPEDFYKMFIEKPFESSEYKNIKYGDYIKLKTKTIYRKKYLKICFDKDGNFYTSNTIYFPSKELYSDYKKNHSGENIMCIGWYSKDKGYHYGYFYSLDDFFGKVEGASKLKDVGDLWFGIDSGYKIIFNKPLYNINAAIKFPKYDIERIYNIFKHIYIQDDNVIINRMSNNWATLYICQVGMDERNNPPDKKGGLDMGAVRDMTHLIIEHFLKYSGII